MLSPLPGALIKRNGILLKDEVELQSGDLIHLGSHYTFMFKDPTASPECQPRLWLTKPRCARTENVLCHTCGSCVTETQKRLLGSENTPPSLKDTDGRDLVLQYPLELEDRILQEIIAMADPQSAEPKLTPAFLLCLCIQHSATRCQTAELRRLLLRIASQVQIAMWVSFQHHCFTSHLRRPQALLSKRFCNILRKSVLVFCIRFFSTDLFLMIKLLIGYSSFARCRKGPKSLQRYSQKCESMLFSNCFI